MLYYITKPCAKFSIEDDMSPCMKCQVESGAICTSVYAKVNESTLEVLRNESKAIN